MTLRLFEGNTQVDTFFCSLVATAQGYLALLCEGPASAKKSRQFQLLESSNKGAARRLILYTVVWIPYFGLKIREA